MYYRVRKAGLLDGSWGLRDKLTKTYRIFVTGLEFPLFLNLPTVTLSPANSILCIVCVALCQDFFFKNTVINHYMKVIHIWTAC